MYPNYWNYEKIFFKKQLGAILHQFASIHLPTQWSHLNPLPIFVYYLPNYISSCPKKKNLVYI
jgi:hypothetical protein